MKKMPYQIKEKLRQYATIQNEAKHIQRELENMIEDYGVPIENLIACGDKNGNEPETEALAFLHNGECDNIERTISQIEEVFLWFVNNKNNEERSHEVMGKRCYIKDKESIYFDEWGIIKCFDGELYHVAIANGSDSMPVFNREQLSIPRKQHCK